MTNAYQRQQQAKKDLEQVWEHPDAVNVIHYSCESFYDRSDGSSPRVTSIAVRNLQTAQTRSFSIHKYGELQGIAAANLNSQYNSLERAMLEGFFQFTSEKREYKWLHWNMRDENYGFHALEQRLRVLGGTPAFVVPDDKKFDLARILVGVYGKGYAGHPRLESLKTINNISSLHFKTGAEEADLFANGNYVGLHQSTLAKVDLIANICQQAHEGNLKTLAGFWDRHGASLKTLVEWLNQHPLIVLTTIAVTVVSAWQLVSKVLEK